MDDHYFARRGLRRLLDLEQGIDVVGEASNAEEALREIKVLSPDVVLMDIRMPGGNGIQATRQLQEEQFQGKIVIVSAYEEYVSQAIEAGAAGYLVKGAKAQEIVSTIHEVHDGNVVFGASVMDTPRGQEGALRYLAGSEASPPQETPASATRSTVNSEVTSAKLTVAAPVIAGALIKLTQWLKETANADIVGTRTSLQGDTILEVTFEQPAPLLRMLSESPDIAEVIEGAQERDVRVTPYLQSESLRMPKRYRVTLKAE